MHPIIRQLSLVTLIALGVSTRGWAQFDPDNYDKQLLEHEIKLLVDSTRLAHGLPALYNDSILYIASGHHAHYLVSKGELSHEEKENKELYSPQDRARYFGAPASYLVGENIVYSSYNASVKVKTKTFQTDSYKEIARCLVYSWVNSKGHFKNILTPEYQITGLAIAVDPKLKRVYACQKFAHVVYTYQFTENTALFPYSTLAADSLGIIKANAFPKADYPFHLKDNKPEICESCKSAWENYPPMSVGVTNNYFVLRIEDAEFVKSLIQKKHDGFAVEIVPFDAFACGNPAYSLEPSRRNNQKRTSGRLLEPVYQKDLMKGFKKRSKVKDLSFVKYLFTADSISFFQRFGRYKLVNFTAGYFEIRLGKVPKDLNGWWNHNLVYIKDRQLCHFVYLTNYPGSLDTSMATVEYFAPVPVNNYAFEPERFTDTLDLFYQSGKTTTSDKELGELVKRFKAQNLTITSIQINGFCSVEGDSLSNDKLHKQRAENILQDLRSFTNTSAKYEVKSQVAWEHFYKSVQNHPKWKFLYPLSKKEISAYLANSKNEQPTEILAQERTVKVIILATKEFSSKTVLYYLNRDLKALFYKDAKKQLRCSDEGKLERLYEKAYYLQTVDSLSAKDFLNFQVPDFFGGKSHRLQHDIAFYRYHLLRETADKTQLHQLESDIEAAFNECGKSDHLSPEFHYLSACLIVKKIEAMDSKKTLNNPAIQKAFDRLNELLTNYKIDSALLFNVAKANLNIINVLCTKINTDQVHEYSNIINKSLIHLTEYYRKTNQLDEVRAFQLAQTMCYFKNIPMAIELCQEFLHYNRMLRLYLPLAYNHSSYLTSDEELLFEQEYHQLLLEAKERLTKEEWCELFYGSEGIPFQIMDNHPLHQVFCETCPNRVNEVLSEE